MPQTRVSDKDFQVYQCKEKLLKRTAEYENWVALVLANDEGQLQYNLGNFHTENLGTKCS